jgi:hypothetical protein
MSEGEMRYRTALHPVLSAEALAKAEISFP